MIRPVEESSPLLQWVPRLYVVEHKLASLTEPIPDLATRLLAGSEVTIGRAPDTDIHISDSRISAYHGTLALSQGRLQYQDTSMNGTELHLGNGPQLKKRGRPTPVASLTEPNWPPSSGLRFAGVDGVELLILYARWTPPEQ